MVARAMRKPDRVEAKLDQLSELRISGDARTIAPFLADRASLVVAKAARMAGELRLFELSSALEQAFDRIMLKPAADKGCTALTAIAQALYDMESGSAAVYLRGIRHVQMEASFGPPVDAAVTLRGLSGLGLAISPHPETMFELARLLADPEWKVRQMAARALGCAGDPAAVHILHYKALSGDEEAEVVGECLGALLTLDSPRYLSLAAGLLASGDKAVAEAAIFAIGALRNNEAVRLLAEHWPRTHGALREVMLTALSSNRHEAAIEFLVSRLGEEGLNTSLAIVRGLASHRGNETVRARVAMKLAEVGQPELMRCFETEFEKP